jgi:hypothetical protein
MTITRNPFDAGGYSLAEMTQAINILPNLYTRLGQIGLFRFEGVSQRSIVIEQREGVLSLLPSVPLGAPATVGTREQRSMRSFALPWIPHDDVILAELARAGLTPDWMPGVVPRCVPVETKRNQHGERSTTVVIGTERVLTRGKWRTIEVLACPVTWRPHPEQIASAQRGYEDWWQALDWVRDGLVAGRMLREVEVTAAMPKVRPWLVSPRK